MSDIGLMPHSLEIEKSIIGGLFWNGNEIADVIEIISPEQFYATAHQIIFGVICKMFGSGKGIDEVTVSEGLTREGGDVQYLKTLIINSIPDPKLIEYCYILKELYIKRELIISDNETMQRCFDPETDALDLLTEKEIRLFNLVRGLQKRTDESVGEILLRTYKDEKKGREATGILTGLPKVDKVLGCFQNSDLIVLAGATSMGKTAMGLTFAYQVAKRNIPVGIISLEMPKVQVLARLRTIETGISMNRILGNKMTGDEHATLNKGDGIIYELPIYIDDSTNINSLELRAKTVGMVRKRGIKILVIDYLQLLAPDDYKVSREQQVSQASRKIKSMAKELEIPVLCLCQVSRKVDTRAGKVPTLSDLRESGAIEQDADVVMFVYRPEYYGEKSFNVMEDFIGNIDPPPRDATGKAILKVAKHRNGPLGDVIFNFDKQRAFFTEEQVEYSSNGVGLPYADIPF